MEILEEHEQKNAPFSLGVWKRLFSYLYGMRYKLVIQLAIVAIMAVVDISFPLLMAYVVNNYIEAGTTDGIWYFATIYFSTVLFQTIMVIIFIRLCMNLELKISERLRNKIFAKFQELSVDYFNNRPVGYLVAKTMSDTERISSLISWGTIDLGWQIIYCAGIFIPMLILNYKLALIIMLIVPIALLLSLVFQKKLLKQNRLLRSANSLASAGLNEGITGAKTSKTLNAEQRLNTEFKELTGDLYRKGTKYHFISSVYSSLLYTLGAFITAVIIVYSGYNFEASGMTTGDITAFLAYTIFLVEPIMALAENLTNFIANQANVERTVDILEKEPFVLDTERVIEKYGDFFEPKQENWEDMQGEIEFRNVSFKYPNSEKYILKDFNLKIPKGSSLALVGETGAGKTTIVNLICRFYEPTEGQILIDGKDYRERSQLWLERSLGYVLQSPHLFSGTIKENICYGKPNATDQEIERAMIAVSADKVCSKLPKGYNSEAGECGDSLSVGEKQIITFARAILANPKIIVLDEATSSIDTETEQLIQNAIFEILKDRTSIMIAHRLSTIKNADNIVLIEDGKIIEQGAHSELMKAKGGYFKLYTKLYEGYIVDKTLANSKNDG